MLNIHAVVLAAGKSSRFIGPQSKLLTKLAGQEILLYSLKLLESLKLPKTYVLGHQKTELQTLIIAHQNSPTAFALQAEPLGTGHALVCSLDSWTGTDILVLNGDMPLLDIALLQSFILQHRNQRADISFITFNAQNPSGYGRVIATPQTVKIVEHKDCNAAQLLQTKVNAGVYLFARDFLRQNLPRLNTSNAAKEFYLTDLIALGSLQQCKIATFQGPEELLVGINTNAEFAVAEAILKRKTANVMLNLNL
jgi:bifunctional UDP-N-acetylglucosamine pyrophosphorylase/glucosamine-1-phosphate N-acetyltransferase